jgi:hypothetical protein
MRAHGGILVLLAALLAWASQARAHSPSAIRSLLAASSASVIFNNGLLEWRSWSWGLASLNMKDASAPAPGARAAMCASVQPFGALSLKSAMPFEMQDGVLGFYIRGNGGNGGSSNASASASAAAAPGLGRLELQLESSSPSRYSITRSLSLAEVLEAQAAAGGSTSAADLLAAIQGGSWTPVKVQMSAFAVPGSTAGGGQESAAFRADRLTMGSCLQRLEGCSPAATPNLDFCLDKLVIVNNGAA